jgi:hypothetical protein
MGRMNGELVRGNYGILCLLVTVRTVVVHVMLEVQENIIKEGARSVLYPMRGIVK